uniref:Nucleoside diphosphate kinase n=1 Tax=Chelonoidis abingdonii TaxID=106734 RepID=A0A8C0HFR6_CHEAB
SANLRLLSRTFLAIKPDGVQRHLIGEMIRRFEKKGFKLLGMKLMQALEDLLKEHYIALCDRLFYSHLVEYIRSGPIVAMVWQGLDVVKIAYEITSGSSSLLCLILKVPILFPHRNVIHGSDSIESARWEILLWFHTDKLTCWAESTEHWIYE